jgi:hypothetical protein
MPIDKTRLAEIATRFTTTMTSIRGRRVHRLALREFAAYRTVVPVRCEHGRPALLALADDGRAALCQTDGSGALAGVQHFRWRDGGAAVAAFDLHKDSLPIVAWRLWHPSLAGGAGWLEIAMADLGADDAAAVCTLLACA